MPNLTDAQIYQSARNAGFPPETAAKMVAIALKESGGNPQAHNPNANTGDNSYGLWQINMIDKPGYPLGDQRRRQFGLSSNEDLWDPDKNAQAAYSIWNKDDVNLEKHWYIMGRDKARYDQYIARGQAAASAAEGRQVITSTNVVSQVTKTKSSKNSPSAADKGEVRNVPDQTGNYTEWRDEGTTVFPEIDIPQPYFATAEIWTIAGALAASQQGGIRNNKDDINPLVIDWQNETDLRLMEFQYSDRRKGAGRFIMRVWMRHYRDVERFAKMCTEKNGVEFRWGYTNVAGGMRDTVSGFVLSYMPEFKDSGFEVSIEGCDMAYQSLGESKLRTFKSKTGRISDIVCYLVRESGLDKNPVIETTVEHSPDEEHKQSAGMTDWWFINEVLSKVAQSKSQRADVVGRHAGYSAYMRDGRFHWHTIVPPIGSARSKAVRNYVWGGVNQEGSGKFGTVISFNPEFKSTTFRNIGAGGTFFNSFNPITKEINQSSAIGSDVQDSMLGGSKSAVTHWMAPGEYPNRAFSRPDHKPEVLEAALSHQYFTLRDLTFQASLVVLGDPWIGCMDVVNVIVQQPSDPGIIMCYDWIVMEAIHTIRVDGTYTTELKMIRSPSAIAKEDTEETKISSQNLMTSPQGNPSVVRKGVLEQKITIATKIKPARVGEIFG